MNEVVTLRVSVSGFVTLRVSKLGFCNSQSYVVFGCKMAVFSFKTLFMNTAPLTDSERASLRAIVDEQSLTRAVASLNIPKMTLIRALANLPMRPLSSAAVRLAINSAAPAPRAA